MIGGLGFLDDDRLHHLSLPIFEEGNVVETILRRIGRVGGLGNRKDEAFEKAGFEMPVISRRDEKWHIDLPMCNRLQLEAVGLSQGNIAVTPDCTFKQPNTWFSARRLGINSGRIFTGIMLK